LRLEDAQREATWVVSKFEHLCDQVMVVGSIRRQRPEVNDIDIVVIPHAPREQNWNDIAKALKRAMGMAQFKKGPKLMTFAHYKVTSGLLGRPRDPEYTVDIYHATPETWGILVLVRTGSKEHNVKLCNLALSKGMKLSAAQGLLKPVDTSGSLMANIACKTEEEIFAALGLPFIEPKDREACDHAGGQSADFPPNWRFEELMLARKRALQEADVK
jgi:DNA polymerase/3'-5' exonuclease PolX